MMKARLKTWARRLPLYGDILQARDTLYAIERNARALLSIAARRELAELADGPRYRDPRMLQRYSLQVNSQNGEDGIIREIFRRIGAENRMFVELGVGDGTENNTAFLLAQGWRGFWVDGRDRFVSNIERADLRERLTYRVSMVDKDNVVGVLENMQVPKRPDLLSIDIDQNTYYVWQALAGYAPRVAVIEYNAALPPDVDWKVRYDAQRCWNGTQNFGAGLKALEKLGTELGYALVACDLHGVNSFFVRRDLVANHFAEPFTAEHHYEPPRYAAVFSSGHAKAILDRA